MFIEIKLLNGFKKPLTYTVPEEWDHSNLLGALIEVPLRNKRVPALITKIILEDQAITFKVKQAIKIYAFPQDKLYHLFIEQISYYYALDQIYWLKRIKQFLGTDTETENILTENNFKNIDNKNNIIKLNQQQEDIVTCLNGALEENLYFPSLLYGVTGSGKTEIYKKLIEKAYSQQKSILLLLPEVTLAIQFASILKEKLSNNINIFSFHSAVNNKEKNALWNHLINKKAALIIGVHLPVLLPIPNLGLIIIDEEHESGFQEKKHPKINTKEIALLRAQLYKIPIILGSATPAVSTFYAAKKKNWKIFTLTERFAGKFPQIETTSLKEKDRRENFWITKKLEKKIAETLKKKSR